MHVKLGKLKRAVVCDTAKSCQGLFFVTRVLLIYYWRRRWNLKIAKSIIGRPFLNRKCIGLNSEKNELVLCWNFLISNEINTIKFYLMRRKLDVFPLIIPYIFIFISFIFCIFFGEKSSETNLILMLMFLHSLSKFINLEWRNLFPPIHFS